VSGVCAERRPAHLDGIHLINQILRAALVCGTWIAW
jgi:hypothetical protein